MYIPRQTYKIYITQLSVSKVRTIVIVRVRHALLKFKLMAVPLMIMEFVRNVEILLVQLFQYFFKCIT